MRIVHICSCSVPSRDPHSIYVMRMSLAFARLGHELILLKPERSGLPAGHPRAEESGVVDPFGFYGIDDAFAIEGVPWRAAIRGRTFLFAAEAARRARALAPDLVFSSMVAGAFASTALGLRVVLDWHDHIRGHGTVTEHLFQRLLRDPDLLRLVVNCGILKDLFEAEFGVAPTRVVAAHNGAELPDPERDRPAPRPEPLDGLHAGYVGSLFPGKGMEVVEAVAPLAPDVTFHVVGGTDRDLVHWRERVGHLGNVRMHGFLPSARVTAFRRSMDVLLVPNQRQVFPDGLHIDIGRWTSPLKIFESMACRVPILASDLPILREVLDEGNARLVDPEDPAGWATALEELRSPDLRNRLADQAFEDFQRRHTWVRRAERVLEGLPLPP